MKKFIKSGLAFLKHRHSNRIDPRARTAGAFDLLEKCFTASDFKLLRKSDEFEAARYATQTLLLTVDGLSGLALWKNLRPSDQFTHLRKRDLEASRERLKQKSATVDDIVEAMNTIAMAVRTMSHAFRLGQFDPLGTEFDSGVEEEDDEEDDKEGDEEEGEEVDDNDDDDDNEDVEDDDEEKEFERDWTFARYKCAALLPYLGKRIRETWLPIKKNIAEQKQRSTRAR